LAKSQQNSILHHQKTHFSTNSKQNDHEDTPNNNNNNNNNNQNNNKANQNAQNPSNAPHDDDLDTVLYNFDQQSTKKSKLKFVHKHEPSPQIVQKPLTPLQQRQLDQRGGFQRTLSTYDELENKPLDDKKRIQPLTKSEKNMSKNSKKSQSSDPIDQLLDDTDNNDYNAHHKSPLAPIKPKIGTFGREAIGEQYSIDLNSDYERDINSQVYKVEDLVSKDDLIRTTGRGAMDQERYPLIPPPSYDKDGNLIENQLFVSGWIRFLSSSGLFSSSS
jgi:hypothetical protein